MPTTAGLSQVDMALLIGWKCASGDWAQMGLQPGEAKDLLVRFIDVMLQGNKLEAITKSKLYLQNALMALRRGSFEEIQGDAPFQRYAHGNMISLTKAFTGEGLNFDQVWNDRFAPGWQERIRRQAPIHILGLDGDSEENALEAIGAPDQETRVASEYWFLNFTFGKSWKPMLHATTSSEDGGRHFSMHDIEVFPNIRKRIFFRLPW